MVELIELTQIVRNRDRLADRWTRFPAHLDFYSKILLMHEPKKSSTVIVLPYSQPRTRPDWAKIIAISNFRVQYSVIEEMSKLLASAVAEMGVVPLIVPIAERSFKEMTWSTPIVRAMAAHGVLMYERNYNYERR